MSKIDLLRDMCKCACMILWLAFEYSSVCVICIVETIVDVL